MVNPRYSLCSLLLLGLSMAPLTEADASPLKVAPNGRYLVDQNDKPFFVHGGSGWSLPMQLSTNEAAIYLEDRGGRGFNAEIWNITDKYYNDHPPANFYGEVPFLTPGDFTTPNDAYFETVDWMIKKAEEEGIVVFATPLYLGNTDQHGWNPEVIANGTNGCWQFGQWLGRRYQGFDNVVWMIGGDRNPSSEVLAGMDAFARGILSEDTNHLVTAHAFQVAAASQFSFDWLSLNNVYSYQDDFYKDLHNAYNRTPVLPFVMIESKYENEQGSTPRSLRRQAYWSILGGACGHFYGNYPIWRFASGWQSHLDDPGSLSMTHVRALFASRAWWLLEPDQMNQIVVNGSGQDATYAAAARTSDGATVIVYLSVGTTISVDLQQLTGEQATAWWFNPRDGTAENVGTFATSGEQSFQSPSEEDWVLVLDDSSRELARPGFPLLSLQVPAQTLDDIDESGFRFYLSQDIPSDGDLIVEVSTNFIDWIEVDVVNFSTPTAEIVDLDATLMGKRFYRIRTP